jgi:hypothetical protein
MQGSAAGGSSNAGAVHHHNRSAGRSCSPAPSTKAAAAYSNVVTTLFQAVYSSSLAAAIQLSQYLEKHGLEPALCTYVALMLCLHDYLLFWFSLQVTIHAIGCCSCPGPRAKGLSTVAVLPRCHTSGQWLRQMQGLHNYGYNPVGPTVHLCYS